MHTDLNTDALGQLEALKVREEGASPGLIWEGGWDGGSLAPLSSSILRYKAVWLIFFMLGLGTLLPWNFFMTATAVRLGVLGSRGLVHWACKGLGLYSWARRDVSACPSANPTVFHKPPGQVPECVLGHC